MFDPDIHNASSSTSPSCQPKAPTSKRKSKNRKGAQAVRKKVKPNPPAVDEEAVIMASDDDGLELTVLAKTADAARNT
jgi:hypothetical protein